MFTSNHRVPEVQRLGFQLGKRTNLSEFEAIYGFRGETNLAHVQAPMVQVGDILHPQTEDYGGLRPIVVPVGVDQDPHLRLTRGIASKTNWFNVKENNGPGVLIGLSVQDENAELLGQQPNGRIDKKKVASIFAMIVSDLAELGFSDINSNPKQGTIVVPSATKRDMNKIRFKLLNLERKLGGMGLLAPASTYHHFAVGLTGEKMSSSKPKTTIFLDDDIDSVTKKIRKAYSGGQSTIEEHRRIGGNPDIDVAYQYMMYFFEESDSYLAELNSEYRNGKILAGEMKQICIDKATDWMENHHELRNQTEHLVKEFLADDALDQAEKTAGSGPVGKLRISSSDNSLSLAESSIIIECPCGSSSSKVNGLLPSFPTLVNRLSSDSSCSISCMLSVNVVVSVSFNLAEMSFCKSLKTMFITSTKRLITPSTFDT